MVCMSVLVNQSDTNHKKDLFIISLIHKASLRQLKVQNGGFFLVFISSDGYKDQYGTANSLLVLSMAYLQGSEQPRNR